MPQQGRLFKPAWLLLLVALCSSSCGKQASLNPVHGKILYRGAPLGGALVSFHQIAEGRFTMEPAVGLTKDDGTFSLTTGQIPGAAVGNYVVTVICMQPIEVKSKGMSMGGEPETEDLLKGKYANAKESQIKRDIKDGPNQLEPLDLQ